jgi:hypothetical protein
MRREKWLLALGLLGHRGIVEWPEIGLNPSLSIGCADAIASSVVSYYTM